MRYCSRLPDRFRAPDIHWALASARNWQWKLPSVVYVPICSNVRMTKGTCLFQLQVHFVLCLCVVCLMNSSVLRYFEYCWDNSSQCFQTVKSTLVKKRLLHILEIKIISTEPVEIIQQLHNCQINEEEIQKSLLQFLDIILLKRV